MIVHNIHLVILLIILSLEVINKSYNKLIFKLQILTFKTSILRIFIYTLTDKIKAQTKQITQHIQLIINNQRKDHTYMRTSYNNT